MIGPILLAISWLLLRFEGNGLGALGFNAPARRSREFAVGFRGYLSYQTIRWLGLRRAVLLDAAAFGIYHWFSYGTFGNLQATGLASVGLSMLLPLVVVIGVVGFLALASERRAPLSTMTA